MKIENIKIDKNIPIPKSSSKYADFIGKMEVGDSVMVENLRARNSLYQVMKRKGWEIVSRKSTNQSYRLWRTK